MPKRTAPDRIQAAAQWHRPRIQAAYESGQLDAPLAAATDWLRAVLTVAAEYDIAHAAAWYDQATRSAAELAAQFAGQIAGGT